MYRSSFFSYLMAVRSTKPNWMRGSVIVLSLAAMGCDVPLYSEVVREPTANICETSASCGNGGECVNSRCRRQGGITEIPAVLLEITPAAGVEANGSPSIAGISYYKTVVGKFEWESGGYEINLEHVSVIEGAVRAPELDEKSCLPRSDGEGLIEPPIGTDGSVRARITLIPRQRLLGLPNPLFTAQAETPDSLGGGGSGYRVALKAPPGRYDVYVEPVESAGGCLRSPIQIINQEIPPGDVFLAIDLPESEILDVTVRYPRASDDLKDWVLDVVQKDSGRLLSTRAVLKDPIERDGALEYDLKVAFSPGGTDGRDIADELVRLSPPEGKVAPTLYLERSLVDLFQDGTGLIDQLTELADVVDYSARVTVVGLTEPVFATVTLVATDLETSNLGTVEGFSASAETGPDGYFQVALLPGTYRAMIEPADAALQRKFVDIVVSDDVPVQAGRTVEILPRHRVSSSVVSFDGNSPIFGATVEAHATPVSARVNVLDRARGLIENTPSALGDLTDDDGAFVLLADEGRFNLSVRPDPTSGFAWSVSLGVDVASDERLMRRQLPLPFFVNGRLTAADLNGGAVPGAQIRMFALLDDGVPTADSEAADSVVAIGEARVGDEGRFELLLPSALK